MAQRAVGVNPEGGVGGADIAWGVAGDLQVLPGLAAVKGPGEDDEVLGPRLALAARVPGVQEDAVTGFDAGDAVPHEAVVVLIDDLAVNGQEAEVSGHGSLLGMGVKVLTHQGRGGYKGSPRSRLISRWRARVMTLRRSTWWP